MTKGAVNHSGALVLGGGGLAGIAWEIGLLARLAELGLELVVGADLVLGTSAGSTVGALVADGPDYEALTTTQRLPPEQTLERVPEFDLDLLMKIFGLITGGQEDPVAVRRQIGALAVSASTVSEAERREIIAARLASDVWPVRPLVITAVDADTGARVTFDATAGVSLVDAVAASSAVPGIWPAVTIDGHRYIDGGVSSITNVDLAAGHDRTVVLCPVGMGPGAPAGAVGGVARPDDGSLVIVADERSVTAFGDNLLDPASRPAALEAGRQQADDVADAIQRYLAALPTLEG